MGSYVQRGFTIIELILFLGITGILFAALMVGVNTNMYQQRYKDSVVEYKTLLEQQYAEVAYPRNDRDDKWTCDSRAGVQPAPLAGQARGTSPCVILGRYVQVKHDGYTVEVGNVIGLQPTDTATITGDGALLAAYAPRLSPIGKQDYQVDWGSQLQTPEERPSAASFLILRSPLSGLVRTFGRVEPLPANLTDMITDTAGSAHITNCITPNGNVGMPTQSITINASIGSANGVVVNGSDEAC